ncbi:MAG: CAP domain-containing protein [Cyanobacteria bacterium J06635_10]
MSPELNQDEIDELVNLLLISSELIDRKALCIRIGIEYNRLGFSNNSSDGTFALRLIHYLNDVRNIPAICKLCCKVLEPIFVEGSDKSFLKEIAIKLNCNCTIENTTKFENNRSEPKSRTGVTQLGKNLRSGVVLKGLLGFGACIALIPFFVGSEPDTTPSPDPTATPSPTATQDSSLLEYNTASPPIQQALTIVNYERRKAGLSPLRQHPQLNDAAQAHSDDMAKNNFIDHKGSDGSSFFNRMKRYGYNFSRGAENITAGRFSTIDAMLASMKSKGLSKNILNDKYSDIGIAYARGGKHGIYWTLVFGSEE